MQLKQFAGLRVQGNAGVLLRHHTLLCHVLQDPLGPAVEAAPARLTTEVSQLRRNIDAGDVALTSPTVAL